MERTLDRAPSMSLKAMSSGSWWLYLLECLDGSHYVGITQDVPLRVARHLVGQGGHHTRSRGVAALIGASVCSEEHRIAIRTERKLKRYPIKRKIEFFRANDRLAELEIAGWTLHPDRGAGARWVPNTGSLAELVARLDRAEQILKDTPGRADYVALDVCATLLAMTVAMRDHVDTNTKPSVAEWSEWIDHLQCSRWLLDLLFSAADELADITELEPELRNFRIWQARVRGVHPMNDSADKPQTTDASSR